MLPEDKLVLGNCIVANGADLGQQDHHGHNHDRDQERLSEGVRLVDGRIGAVARCVQLKKTHHVRETDFIAEWSTTWGSMI